MLIKLITLLRRGLHALGFSLIRTPFPQDNEINLLDLLVRLLLLPKSNIVLVQIGANDGKTGDPVHKYIERFGWRSIQVEPIPDVFQRLSETYRHMPNVVCENAALSHQDGICRLFRVRPNDSLPAYVQQLASFKRSVILKQRRSVSNIADFIDEITVPALTFATLLEKHGIQRIDLLQIDTEGFDYEIIKMVMATTLRPTIINFESIHLSSEEKEACAKLLAAEGYRYSTWGRDTTACLADEMNT